MKSPKSKYRIIHRILAVLLLITLFGQAAVADKSKARQSKSQGSSSRSSQKSTRSSTRAPTAKSSQSRPSSSRSSSRTSSRSRTTRQSPRSTRSEPPQTQPSRSAPSVSSSGNYQSRTSTRRESSSRSSSQERVSQRTSRPRTYQVQVAPPRSQSSRASAPALKSSSRPSPQIKNSPSVQPSRTQTSGRSSSTAAPIRNKPSPAQSNRTTVSTRSSRITQSITAQTKTKSKPAPKPVKSPQVSNRATSGRTSSRSSAIAAPIKSKPSLVGTNRKSISTKSPAIAQPIKSQPRTRGSIAQSQEKTRSKPVPKPAQPAPRTRNRPSHTPLSNRSTTAATPTRNINTPSQASQNSRPPKSSGIAVSAKPQQSQSRERISQSRVNTTPTGSAKPIRSNARKKENPPARPSVRKPAGKTSAIASPIENKSRSARPNRRDEVSRNPRSRILSKHKQSGSRGKILSSTNHTRSTPIKRPNPTENRHRISNHINTSKIRGHSGGSKRRDPDERQGGRFSRHHHDRTHRKPTRDNTIIINNIVNSKHGYSYEDRPHHRYHRNHHTHLFRDHHRRLCFQMIWPKYRLPVWYHRGHHVRHHYVYPYYKRRYVFVSLNGCWPSHHSYIRYHWYPTHYYSWYGYHPVAQRVQSDTYNYYTYNYYGDQASTVVDFAPVTTPSIFVSHETFADIREKLAAEKETGPPQQELSDIFFEAAVKAFEDGNYQEAADRFDWALQQAPDDQIIPFAYAQALFADGQYQNAAASLRGTLQTIDPEKDGIIYPRGLYLEEEILLKQVDLLTETAEKNPLDSNLQLLLGYHLLGLGNTEESIPLLTAAVVDPMNTAAATVLLNLAQKITTENIMKNNG